MIDLRLHCVGDICARQATLDAFAADPTCLDAARAVLERADVRFANLEAPLVADGRALFSTGVRLKSPPALVGVLQHLGFEVVTLANNHMLDYGRIGLADTLAAAKAAGFPTVGAGADAQAAWAPWITTVRGTKIAYIGVSDVQELAPSWIATPTRSGVAIANDRARTLAAVRAAKREADVVVVFMHWGTEGDSCPDPSQKSLAIKLSAAGADIIVGAHVHTLQGNGWLGHTFVAYGMGNFLWYINSWSTQTGVLRLTLHTTPTGALASTPLDARFIPAIVSKTGQPVVQTGAKGAAIAKRYASLRACAGLSAAPH
ncbi:MAG TPA: CapA family protein [Micromonosporaceae bacterium]